MQAPAHDAKILMSKRFPTPRYIECVEKGSQSRFLMAKLNPSLPQTNMNDVAGAEPVFFSEDVSLKVFLQHLRRLAVQEG